MKARWIQQPTGLMSQQQLLAVSEDDEVLASVVEYNGQWIVDVSQPAQHRSAFITEEAAKRRVEQKLAPVYTFAQPVTGWVYKVQP